jgi:hypothetical protein
MSERLRITIANLILLIVPMLIGAPSHAQASAANSVDSNESQKTMKAWLSSAGLADTFDIVRIGPGPHPDPQFAMDGMIHHLELRFVAASSDQAKGAAHLQMLLADYERDHAIALTEKLLYEFADALAVDPRDVCVDLHLYDVVYYVYLSRSDGSLVVSKASRASYDVFSVTIPSVAPQEQFRTHFAKQSAPDAKSVRGAVETFLRTYLESMHGQGSAKPEITADMRRQDEGYVHLLVSGVRGTVTDGYWEWLDIAVIFHQDPAPATGKDSVWNFICNVEVKYASSPRETRPTDADFDYPRQVAHFRTQLGQQLQANLEKGIHD